MARGVSYFLTGLVVYGFTLAQGTRASHLVSGFLTKGMDLCIVIEMVCLWGGRESSASYFIIFLILPPLLISVGVSVILFL